MSKLVLQRQPDQHTCVAACLAMVLNRPVQEVVDEFHADFEQRKHEVDQYACTQGALLARTEDRQRLQANKVYFLLVPSLNSPGMFHQVLADTRHGFEIFDPARQGTQAYCGRSEFDLMGEPGYTQILTWIIDYEVIHAPAIGILNYEAAEAEGVIDGSCS